MKSSWIRRPWRPPCWLSPVRTCSSWGGTSLVVYPAAGLINYYRGDKLVLINRDATPYDRRADLVIHDAIGKVLGGIKT